LVTTGNPALTYKISAFWSQRLVCSCDSQSKEWLFPLTSLTGMSF
jgi:hypothetical protein